MVFLFVIKQVFKLIICFSSDLESDESVATLKSHQVIKCVAQCLNKLTNGKFSVSPDDIDESINMSVKYKYATLLATAIQVCS